MEAEEGGSLIPGLPEELVLIHVVSRLPWYSRPVCRSISKYWRASIDTLKSQAGLAVETRKHQLPLLKGLFLICTSADVCLFLSKGHADNAKQMARYHIVQEGQIHRQWRRLPPLQGLLPLRDVALRANYGMVYVWSAWKSDVVLKMNLGCGDWTWSTLSVPVHFYEDVICNGKIYVPMFDPEESQTEKCEKDSLYIYDMMTDHCKQVKPLKFREMRVLTMMSSRSGSHVEEELYGLVEHKSKLELVVYDACKDTWSTKTEIPTPDFRWSELSQVKLLNGSCFEPAAKMDVDIIWWDYEVDYISWLNPSLHNCWVHMECNYGDLIVDDVLFIRGSLYGVLLNFDEEDDDEDEDVESEEEEDDLGGQLDVTLCDSTIMNQQICKHKDDNSETDKEMFCKRTIMKGRIYAAEGILRWEKVLDVGCFEEHAILPVDSCTIIA
ncbi:hypothetical protein L7F22_057452 [Adiantum nelumboides]|nr:hypothetical protein [Adiantum nelumboides]